MSITLRSKENYCMGRMGPRLCIQTTTACNGKCYFVWGDLINHLRLMWMKL